MVCVSLYFNPKSHRDRALRRCCTRGMYCVHTSDKRTWWEQTTSWVCLKSYRIFSRDVSVPIFLWVCSFRGVIKSRALSVLGCERIKLYVPLSLYFLDHACDAYSLIEGEATRMMTDICESMTRALRSSRGLFLCWYLRDLLRHLALAWGWKKGEWADWLVWQAVWKILPAHSLFNLVPFIWNSYIYFEDLMERFFKSKLWNSFCIFSK